MLVARGDLTFEVELATDGSFEAAFVLGNASADGVDLTAFAYVDGWWVPSVRGHANASGDEPLVLVRTSGEMRVAIRVVYADGRAATHERLAFLSSLPDMDGVGLYGEDGSLDERALARYAREAIVVHTDGNGRATVDLANGVLHALAGARDLVADSDPSPIDTNTKEATVTLRRAYGIELHLIDAVSGAPVLNAEVRLTEDREGPAGHGWSFSGTSERVGFRRTVVEPDSLPVRLHVEVEGLDHVATKLDLELTDAAPFVVRTSRLDPIGPGTSGELLLLTPWTADLAGDHLFGLWLTKTAGRGSMRLPALRRARPDRWTTRLPPGSHEIRVVPSPSLEELGWTTTVEIRAGVTTTIEPRLPPNGRLRVTATPPPATGHAADVRIEIRRANGSPFWERATSIPIDGLTVPFVPVGAYVLRVGRSDAPASYPFSIDPDRTTEVVVAAAK